MPNSAIQHRPIHAPRDDRATLVEPARSSLDEVLARNRAALAEGEYDVQGVSLSRLSAEARRHMLCEARRWTGSYRDVPPITSDRLLLAGHQPQLFHPGVWFKNFVLADLAARHRAVAINLVIDSDAVKSVELRVPTGSFDAPRAARVPIDQPSAVIPYEERRIRQRGDFCDFGRRVAEQVRPLVARPMIDAFWPLAAQRSCQTDNLGACLAQARHQWEGQWGLETLEVPQSRICQSPAFFRFTAHVLAHLPRFRQVYNEAVAEYRRVNGIRNAAHPVPDLAGDEPWMEAPFWIWSAADPQRRPLYARPVGPRHVTLSNGAGWEAALPLSAEADAGPAVERLTELAHRGIRIRSRALVTTMWARLVLGDVFLHGIGGAKYDQVTDAIIERFFGLGAPEYYVVSATLRLPIERPHATPDDVRQVRRGLRELDWHPERFLSEEGDAGARRLVEEKARWIATPVTPQNVGQRFRAIRQVNAALQPWVEPLRREMIELDRRARQLAQADAVLAWREYAFCLYPEEQLRGFFAEALETTP